MVLMLGDLRASLKKTRSVSMYIERFFDQIYLIVLFFLPKGRYGLGSSMLPSCVAVIDHIIISLMYSYVLRFLVSQPIVFLSLHLWTKHPVSITEHSPLANPRPKQHGLLREKGKQSTDKHPFSFIWKYLPKMALLNSTPTQTKIDNILINYLTMSRLSIHQCQLVSFY